MIPIYKAEPSICISKEMDIKVLQYLDAISLIDFNVRRYHLLRDEYDRLDSKDKWGYFIRQSYLLTEMSYVVREFEAYPEIVARLYPHVVKDSLMTHVKTHSEALKTKLRRKVYGNKRIGG